MDLGFKIQKTNLGIRIRILKIPNVPISKQNEQIWLSWPKFAQKWIFSSKLRRKCWNKNEHPWDIMCAKFELRRTIWTFVAQICPKRKLGFETQKANVGIKISTLEIPCVPIFRKNEQLWIFGPKFAQKWILGSKFQKSQSWFGISILEILCTPIFRQNGQFWIFGPKFAQKWILGSEFPKSMDNF